MKRIFFILIMFSKVAYSQVAPQQQLNTRSHYNLTDTVRNFDIRERLVQLAMNNPTYEISDRLANVAEYQLRIAKGSWLTALNAAGNINEFTINKSAAGSTVVTTSSGTTSIPNQSYYPRYNFGLSIPFDMFTRIPNNVKIAKENYFIAQAQKNDRYRQIRAEVLTKYEDYLLANQKMEIQIQIAQDAYTNYQVIEKSYLQNNIKTDDLNRAYKQWAIEQIAKLDLQRNLNVSKIDLERIIGVKLDDVLKQNY